MADDFRYYARLQEIRDLTVPELMEHIVNELHCFVALRQMADRSSRDQRVSPFAAVARDCVRGMRTANYMLAGRVSGFADTRECIDFDAAVDDAMQEIDALVLQPERRLSSERATQLSALLRSHAGRLIVAYQLADGWLHGRLMTEGRQPIPELARAPPGGARSSDRVSARKNAGAYELAGELRLGAV